MFNRFQDCHIFQLGPLKAEQSKGIPSMHRNSSGLEPMMSSSGQLAPLRGSAGNSQPVCIVEVLILHGYVPTYIASFPSEKKVKIHN